MAEVKLQEGETLENALRRFKRKVQQEDIIKEVKTTFLLLEAGREETGQAGAGPQAEPEKVTPGNRVTGRDRLRPVPLFHEENQ